MEGQESATPRTLLTATFAAVSEGIISIALYEWFSEAIKGTRVEEFFSQHVWAKPFILLVGFAVLFIILRLLLSWQAVAGPLRALRRAIGVGGARAWAELRGEARTTYFDVAERADELFREAMKHCIQNSEKIYFRLVSGDTMFHEPVEQFILGTLDGLTATDGRARDRRVQLLDRSTDEFQRRARWFVDETLDRRRPGRPLVGFDQYMHACEDNERSFRERGFTVFQYRSRPNWRLHIFDDAAFVSSYGEKEEGHRTPCIMIPRESRRGQRPNPLYRLLLTEFERCCNEQRARPSQIGAELERIEPPGGEPDGSEEQR